MAELPGLWQLHQVGEYLGTFKYDTYFSVTGVQKMMIVCNTTMGTQIPEAMVSLLYHSQYHKIPEFQPLTLIHVV